MSKSIGSRRAVRGIPHSLCIIFVGTRGAWFCAASAPHIKRTLAVQDGPSILVAHSYGGAEITEAGTDPAVVGLVYIAAHMPDSSEKESEDGKRFPTDLAKSGAIKKTRDGFTYIDPARFHQLFAADLPAEQAAFMARSRVFNFSDNFSATITTAAWRAKPSWMVVAGSDRTISPDLETLVCQASQ